MRTEGHSDRLNQLEAELSDVESALLRLEDGSYGRCDICGAAIDDGRLAEQPLARSCPEHDLPSERAITVLVSGNRFPLADQEPE